MGAVLKQEVIVNHILLFWDNEAAARTEITENF